MIKSLYISLNKIKAKNQIPKQWLLATVKSIHKSGVKENIQENQRRTFSKTYVSAFKIQNENKIDNLPQMQTAGRKQRATVDNPIILKSMTEKQRQNKNKTYLFYVDDKKCKQKCII